jgi:osmotically-inducible protein OsmY
VSLDYLAGHVREALAAELDVEAVVVNDRIVLSGAVASEARRDEAIAIARAVCGDVEVVGDLVVRASPVRAAPEERL